MRLRPSPIESLSVVLSAQAELRGLLRNRGGQFEASYFPETECNHSDPEIDSSGQADGLASSRSGAYA